MIYLVLKPMPKKRPIVTTNGTFMPAKYVAWKQEFATLAREQLGSRPPVTGPLELDVRFTPTGIEFDLWPSDLEERPKHLRTQDIDNLAGAVMDALQDARIIDNDIQIVTLTASITS